MALVGTSHIFYLRFLAKPRRHTKLTSEESKVDFQNNSKLALYQGMAKSFRVSKKFELSSREGLFWSKNSPDSVSEVGLELKSLKRVENRPFYFLKNSFMVPLIRVFWSKKAPDSISEVRFRLRSL